MIRLLLSLSVVAFFALCVAGMWLGWRNRGRRQAYLPAPPLPPVELPAPLLPPATGVYVGTTTAGNWQDRIVAGGLGHRAATEIRLYDNGVLMDRAGGRPLWIPAGALTDARADRALAGKVMGTAMGSENGTAGLLVFRWRLGEHDVESGVRGDDRDSYPEWISAVRAMAADPQRGERT